MPTNAGLLAEVPFFTFLDEKEREDLARVVHEVTAPAGQTLFNYGDPGDSLYVIRSGAVEVFFRDDTGTRILLETARSGDFFGELSLLDGGARTASVAVIEDMEALRVDRDDLDQFLRTRPGAALGLLAAMGRRLRFTAEKLRHTASRNVNEEAEDRRTAIMKVADWIAEFSGSIPFLMIHVVIFTAWIVLNLQSIPWAPRFDPFPYGLLTMAVSLEAIFLSVFVLLSQNRQASKDRVRSDIEYDVNLKAEREVAHLHEKVDQLAGEVARRLEALERALAKKPGP